MRHQQRRNGSQIAAELPPTAPRMHAHVHPLCMETSVHGMDSTHEHGHQQGGWVAQQHPLSVSGVVPVSVAVPCCCCCCCWRPASLALLLLLLLVAPLLGVEQSIDHDVLQGGLLGLTDVEKVAITT
jgi:hypothetical protein